MSLALKWEFPGGKVESDETEEDCLVREIREELNLEIGILERLPSITHSYSAEKIIELIPFKCELVQDDLQLSEHLQVKWLHKEELFSLDWSAADIPIVEYYIKHH